MLYYIVDGFNVIHKIRGVAQSNSPHRDLINYIKHHKLTGNKSNKVAIIFDGSINYDVLGEKEFEIRFSLEKKADELIKARIQNAVNKAQLLVVSNDREIVDFAKKMRAGVVTVEQFLKKSAKPSTLDEDREISYSDQRIINEELKKIWLKE